MANIFEILKTSKNSLSAKQVISEKLTHVISNLYIFMQMLNDDKKEKVINEIRNDLVSNRFAIDDFLENK